MIRVVDRKIELQFNRERVTVVQRISHYAFRLQLQSSSGDVECMREMKVNEQSDDDANKKAKRENAMQFSNCANK